MPFVLALTPLLFAPMLLFFRTDAFCVGIAASLFRTDASLFRIDATCFCIDASLFRIDVFLFVALLLVFVALLLLFLPRRLQDASRCVFVRIMFLIILWFDVVSIWGGF